MDPNDPNDPNQPTQPTPTPPPWATAPYGTPDAGAPQPPNTPQAGSPWAGAQWTSAPGESAPQPGDPAPQPGVPWAPGGAMAAGAVAPPPATRSRRKRFGIIGVVAVVIIGVAVAVALLLPGQGGKILFVTKVPRVGDSCTFSNTITTLNKGSDAWFVIDFKSKMDTQPVTLDIVKDGVPFIPTVSYSVGNTKDIGCVFDPTDLNTFPAGDYKFTAHHAGAVEATGELVIK